MIARAGKDLGEVKSKEEMHAVLGEPAARGVADGKQYEEFRTRKMIAEDQSFGGEGYAMLLIMTCGACDLVFVPYECCLLGKRTLLGQTIRVTYERDGGIADVERDGESVLGLRRFHRSEEQEGEPSPPAVSAVPSPAPSPQ
jgi:hypothetical protein